MKLIVLNGTVLTMDSAFGVIENGAVVVEDGRIVAVDSVKRLRDVIPEFNTVSPGADPSQMFNALLAHNRGGGYQLIDAKGGIILPGLVNSHTHAAMTLFRGLADDLPLMTWLQDHIFPAEAKLTPEMVHQGTLLACAEMIFSGTTTFCDMYLFENEVAKAASACGVRAVVGEVLYDFPSPGYGEIDKGFDHVAAMMDQWKDDPLITVAVEPHATYTCAPDLLQRAAALAEKHNAPLIVHVAETHAETLQIKEKYGNDGETPVQFLASLGILGPRLLACHSVHLTKKDLDLYREHDVKVAHCPESNMKLASGVAPVAKMLAQNICVGLGTDGCASNNDLDMFGEMDSAAKLHKVFSLDPEVLDAQTVLKMATIDGARVLGLENEIGSLEVGKRADIIVVDTDRPHMVPMYNPYSHMVYTATGSDVSTTIIDGKVVMQDRKLMTMDVEKVMDDVLASAKIIRNGK